MDKSFVIKHLQRLWNEIGIEDIYGRYAINEAITAVNEYENDNDGKCVIYLHPIGEWEEVPKKPTCPKCGAWLHTIPVGSHYCYSCGTRLKWGQER